jgi:hypothetical protein
MTLLFRAKTQTLDPVSTESKRCENARTNDGENPEITIPKSEV